MSDVVVMYYTVGHSQS